MRAPERPANASDPFDPAYKLDDIDEAVRNAQSADMEVMLTITGTPSWANGGKTPNRMPIGSPISPRSPGHRGPLLGPLSRLPVRPLLVRVERAEPDAVPRAAVQLEGEVRRARELREALRSRLFRAEGRQPARTGRDRRDVRARKRQGRSGIRPTHSPGKFAELVAKANPRLKFQAWAQHPYPTNPGSPPTQLLKWPNVSLKSLPRFDASLKTWFKRKSVPIWITEYGYQTRPPDTLGVPWSTQSKYISQAISLAKGYPFVGMFIWFVYQDDPGQPWESGVYTQAGIAKATSPGRFSASAKPLDARDGVYSFKAGVLTPLVKLYTRRYCANDTTGTAIGMTWRIFRGSKLIAVGQQTSRAEDRLLDRRAASLQRSGRRRRSRPTSPPSR